MGLKYILFSLKLYYSSMIFNMEIVEEAVMAYKKLHLVLKCVLSG